MRLSLWALVCGVGLLAAAPAGAREHTLHPVASGAAIPGLMTLTPREIDVTAPDYTLIVEIRNDTDQWLVIPVQGTRCVRGGLETLADGGPARPLLLAPWQAKDLKLRCDHGPWVTGDYGLVLPQVATHATGDRWTPGVIVAEQVTWRLRERDVTRHRQREAEGSLAQLTWCRPSPPVVVAEPEVPAAAPSAALPPAATLSTR
jgi:hypothetical protein